MKPKPFIISMCPICGERIQQAAAVEREPKPGCVLICTDGAFRHIIGTDGIERVLFILPDSQKESS